MTIVQWLLLVLIVVVVIGAYWYLRRQADGDPWQGMDDDSQAPADDQALDRGESLGGDSYIVGVRTLSKDTPASRKPADGGSDTAAGDADRSQSGDDIPDDAADASWQAYKSAGAQRQPAAEPEAPAPDRSAPEPAPVPGATQRVEIQPQPPPADGEQELFILHVASPDGRFFDGPDIHAALQSQELRFGLNDIYHRVTETRGVSESVFAVANMLKPGSLDPVEQDHLSTPGLTLFLVLPCPIEGMPAMRDMMETANAVAQALGGEVLDDKRARLTAQTAQYMLDRIAEIDRRARIARRR